MQTTLQYTNACTYNVSKVGQKILSKMFLLYGVSSCHTLPYINGGDRHGTYLSYSQSDFLLSYNISPDISLWTTAAFRSYVIHIDIVNELIKPFEDQRLFLLELWEMKPAKDIGEGSWQPCRSWSVLVRHSATQSPLSS